MNFIKILISRQFIIELLRIIAVGIASLLFYFLFISLPVLLVVMAFGLFGLAKSAITALFKERKVGTELFVTVAVSISVIGAEYLAGAVVLMIILIAEYIASASGERARQSIRELIGTAPRTATVKKGGLEESVDIDTLQVGDNILVRAGEKIPVDGKVISGNGSVNQAPITGESFPQEKRAGSDVFAGTILELGALDIRMSTMGKDTVFSRIVSMIEDAEVNKAPIEKYTDRVASYLIPVVFIFVLAVYIFTRDIKLIIALLIFTSPAELGLATPLVTIAAIARAAREGILIKGGLYLEELAKIDTVVFDKTGTLTIGSPVVTQLRLLGQATKQEVIHLAATADRRSSHPLAKAIIQYASDHDIALSEPEDFQVIKGRGVSAVISGKQVFLGNSSLMSDNGLAYSETKSASAETLIFLAADGNLLAVFHVADALRKGGINMISGLRKSGIKDIIMLTGDNSETAKHISDQIGITSYFANLLPQDKIEKIKDLQSRGARVAMVGDGINDSPALVQANIGIAMGAMGTEAAMEAADIVLMEDKLEKIARARAISKKAYKTIRENIFFGVGVVHIIGITLVLLRILGPVEAAAIHLLPDILVFLNSIKLLKVKIE